MALDVASPARESTPAMLDAATRRARANLDALDTRQSDLAAVLRPLSLPASATLTTGRDGALTWRVEQSAGGRWFGGSSMPTISAPIIVSGYVPDGGSLWLPGMLTGLEPLVLLDRMPRSAALFVVEQDVVQVLLAFHLYDYAPAFTAGRLVILIDGALAEGLEIFVTRHPGYTVPRRFLPVSNVDIRRLDEIQQAIELASARAVQAQSRLAEAARGSLAKRPPWGDRTAVRTALVSRDARPWALDFAARAARAIAARGDVALQLVPDAPDKCHAAALLQAVDRDKAGLALAINGATAELQRLLPPTIPLAEWYFPGAVYPERIADAPVGGPLVFASTASVRRELVGRGVPNSAIVDLPLGGDHVMFRTVRLSPAERAAWSCDVLLARIPPSLEVESTGLTLPSHIELWNACITSARGEPRAVERADAEAILRRAETRLGMQLVETAVRTEWVEMIRTRLLPAVHAELVVSRLAAEGLIVAAIDTHGGGMRHPMDCRPLDVRSPDDCNMAINAARVVLILDQDLVAVQAALDTLMVGTPVVMHGLERVSTEHPHLADAFRSVNAVESIADVVASCRRLARTGSSGASAIAGDIRREHSIAERIDRLVRTVHGRLA